MDKEYCLVSRELRERLDRDFTRKSYPQQVLFAGGECRGKFYEALRIARRLSKDIKGGILYYSARNMKMRLLSAHNLFPKSPAAKRNFVFTALGAFCSILAGGALDNDGGADEMFSSIFRLENLLLSTGDTKETTALETDIFEFLFRFKYRESMSIEDTRNLKPFLSMYLPGDAVNTVIVENLENANASVSNSFLKLLEEPFDRTVIILLSSTPQRLLKTVQSRVRRYNFAPVADLPEFHRQYNAEGDSDIKSVIEQSSYPEMSQIRQAACDYAVFITSGKDRQHVFAELAHVFDKAFLPETSNKEKSICFFSQLSDCLEKAFLSTSMHRNMRIEQLQGKINRAVMMIDSYNASPMSQIELLGLFAKTSLK